MTMKPQTAEFVDREQALASFEELLRGGAQAALAFQAPNGLGKSYLLREMRLLSESSRVKVVLVETAREFVPNHWHIIRRMVEHWPESMPHSAAMLQRLESLLGPLERLPGGGIVITGGTFSATGDLVIGEKTTLGSDAQEREYRGLQAQVNQAFFADLAQICRMTSQAPEPNQPGTSAPTRQGDVLLLLFDNVDLATEETRDWLAQILRRMWAGDLPNLGIVLTGQSLSKLGGGGVRLHGSAHSGTTQAGTRPTVL